MAARSHTERWGSGKPPASIPLPPTGEDADMPSVEEALEPFVSKAPPPPSEPDDADRISNVAAKELLQFIQRIERLEEEKKAISDDIKDVYAELKARGFDTKATRTIIKMRRQDAAERQEQEAILALYLDALGMV